MKVLIAKANEDILTECLQDIGIKKISFEESTKNTSFFSISKTKFIQLYDVVKAYGYNPYALMAW